MLARIVPKVGRNYQPVFFVFENIVFSERHISTSPSSWGQKRSPAWDYIIPMVIRAFKNNQAQRKDMCQTKWQKSSAWQDKDHHHGQDWEKTITEWVKMFENANVNKFGARKEHKVRYDSSGFEVTVDTQHFAPAELDVKIDGTKLTILGKHEPKEDEHGFISRQFCREINIPEDVKTETFESSLSDDGYLVLRADVEGAEKGKKTIEIKFERKKED